MARTADEMADVLKGLYRKGFEGDYRAAFQLTWDQLRGMAGAAKLEVDYLNEVNEVLLGKGFALLTFNNSFIVAKDGDFDSTRQLPARLAERYREEDEDEDADIDVPDDDEDETDFETEE
ncbi:hypothetical protein KP003_02800 [Geomonas nitrogeniifigens]|uniref:hypothetical protein n=1 Tax=Geomonas diazotrophica TaxID=2843197 RepID=UPI001C2BD4AA|nr:hypothetical protein [Geomonas nitrogeniifigens]QXE87353.1 hypothetical protein KP003_02800 [Geomonas nitrogeniifigens]